MIYEEEIIVNSKVKVNKFTPLEIWCELRNFLDSHGHLAPRYELGVDMMKTSPYDLGKTIAVDTNEICDALKEDQGAPLLQIAKKQDRGILDDQRIQYSGNQGFLDMYGEIGWFPNEWDSFFQTSKVGRNIVNVLVAARLYMRDLNQYKIRPENDLLKAPGLANDRGAYLEGVSAEMWFGESFWQYAACSKEDVLACDWIKCQDRGFQLHVEAWPEPFTSAEGEQGVVQRKLLDLLFGIGSDTENKQPPPMPKMS